MKNGGQTAEGSLELTRNMQAHFVGKRSPGRAFCFEQSKPTVGCRRNGKAERMKTGRAILTGRPINTFLGKGSKVLH